jgi:hypothetical protein
MLHRWLADLVLVIHLAFIVFVVLGGLAVLWCPRLAWAHLPTAAWGVIIEWSGWMCPLTPLENHFRQLGGEAGYEGGFIEHYVWPLIYPHGLTREIQLVLGAIVLVVNLLVYWRVVVLWRRRRRRREVDLQ